MINKEHEEKVWDEIFQKELKNNSHKIFSSYWWEDYYNDISNFIEENVIKKFEEKIDVIEVGSGSWKSSLLLWEKVKSITLLDISNNALKYAELLAKKLNVDNVNFVNWDMFEIKFLDEKFDFTWNIWTLEHYNDEEIFNILQEMFRITKKWGYIAFWIPNKNSWPIIKARILTIPMFKFIPWYRLDTERFFTNQEIFKFLRSLNISEKNINFIRFWSFLPMETPKFLIKFTKNFFENYKFLNFYLIKK